VSDYEKESDPSIRWLFYALLIVMIVLVCIAVSGCATVEDSPEQIKEIKPYYEIMYAGVN
jgi:uncharacterized protein YceK